MSGDAALEFLNGLQTVGDAMGMPGKALVHYGWDQVAEKAKEFRALIDRWVPEPSDVPVTRRKPRKRTDAELIDDLLGKKVTA